MNRFAKIALLSAALTVGSADALAACMTSQESSAEQVRILQLELMVAALQCRNVEGSRMTALYNEVVTKHRTGFGQAARALDSHYRRVEPKGYLRAADAQATQISNQMSTFGRSAPGFCGRAEAIADELLVAVTPANLADIARALPEVSEMSSPRCPVQLEAAR